MKRLGQKSDRFARLYDKLQEPNDGTREGGLVFLIIVFSGIVGAVSFLPEAFTSIWIWILLLIVASYAAQLTERFVKSRNKSKN